MRAKNRRKCEVCRRIPIYFSDFRINPCEVQREDSLWQRSMVINAIILSISRSGGHFPSMGFASWPANAMDALTLLGAHSFGPILFKSWSNRSLHGNVPATNGKRDVFDWKSKCGRLLLRFFFSSSSYRVIDFAFYLFFFINLQMELNIGFYVVSGLLLLFRASTNT